MMFGALEIDRLDRIDICRYIEKDVLVLLDIPSMYLLEVAVDLNLVKRLLHVIKSCGKHVEVLINPFIGGEEASKILKDLDVVNISRLPKTVVEVYGYGGTLKHVEVYDVRKLGMDLCIVFNPRTADYAPLLLSTALSTLYIVDRRYLDNFIQGFVWTNINIARTFLTQGLDLCIALLDKVIEGNGPIYGVVRKGVKELVMISKQCLFTDSILAKTLGFNPKDIGYLHILSIRTGMDIDSRIANFNNAISMLRGMLGTTKIRKHDMANIAIEMWRKKGVKIIKKLNLVSVTTSMF